MPTPKDGVEVALNLVDHGSLITLRNMIKRILEIRAAGTKQLTQNEVVTVITLQEEEQSKIMKGPLTMSNDEDMMGDENAFAYTPSDFPTREDCRWCDPNDEKGC